MHDISDIGLSNQYFSALAVMESSTRELAKIRAGCAWVTMMDVPTRRACLTRGSLNKVRYILVA